MLGDAVREIRFHPGRFVATLVAIAISVGFLAAVSIFMASEANALGRMTALSTSAADVVVDTIPYNPKTYVEPAKDPATFTIDQIRKVKGVALAEAVQSESSILSVNDKTDYVELTGVPSAPFQWTQPVEGRWPSKQGELALSTDTMKKLGLKLGGQVEVGGEDTKATVVGVTEEPSSLFGSTGYMPRQDERSGGEVHSLFVIKLAPGADPATVVAALNTMAKPYGLQAQTRSDYQRSTLNQLTSEINVTKYILQIFGAIALLIGVITIANTFNILVVQRRRQIGLLRAVGASGSQIRRRQLAEAFVLGVFGSLLGLLLGTGISAIGMWVTKTLWAGLQFPWQELALWVLVGTLATVIAAVLPAIRATRVAPLEALQPVPTSEAARRASWVRLAISLVLVAVGAGLAAAALTQKSNNIALALGAAGSLTIGVLVGAVFLVPWFTRVLGWGLSRLGATPRLAELNALRNPRRTAATATALMLAVGLIITLQVGLATVNKSAIAALEARSHSIDITMTYSAQTYAPDSKPAAGELSQTLVDSAKSTSGVQAAVPVKGTVITEREGLTDDQLQWVWWTALAPNPELATLTSKPLTAADDEVLLPFELGRTAPSTISLPAADGSSITLKVKLSQALSYPALMVSEATLAKLTAKPSTVAVWIKLVPDADLSAVMASLARTPQVASGQIQMGGGAVERYQNEQVIRILTIVLTALMGVAVLVALVGVANTLGLSILERMRESALLRAMGMQRRSLRMMLLIEAMIITFAGVLIGVAAGVFFAWLGITAVFKQLNLKTLQFAIDWQLTGGLLLVAAAAAALASIVPGRKAALAPPTEALAAD